MMRRIVFGVFVAFVVTMVVLPARAMAEDLFWLRLQPSSSDHELFGRLVKVGDADGHALPDVIGREMSDSEFADAMRAVGEGHVTEAFSSVVSNAWEDVSSGEPVGLTLGWYLLDVPWGIIGVHVDTSDVVVYEKPAAVGIEKHALDAQGGRHTGDDVADASGQSVVGWVVTLRMPVASVMRHVTLDDTLSGDARFVNDQSVETTCDVGGISSLATKVDDGGSHMVLSFDVPPFCSEVVLSYASAADGSGRLSNSAVATVDDGVKSLRTAVAFAQAGFKSSTPSGHGVSGGSVAQPASRDGLSRTGDMTSLALVAIFGGIGLSFALVGMGLSRSFSRHARDGRRT